jgi:hypothetical protein
MKLNLIMLWFMPVEKMANWEAEIWRILVPVQPRQIICENSTQQKTAGYGGTHLSSSATVSSVK